MDKNVAGVPKYKWHWSPWLGNGLLSVVPGVSISVDATGSVSIDMNAVSADDEARVVVLKSNWVGVVSPVVEIV